MRDLYLKDIRKGLKASCNYLPLLPNIKCDNHILYIYERTMRGIKRKGSFKRYDDIEILYRFF